MPRVFLCLDDGDGKKKMGSPQDAAAQHLLEAAWTQSLIARLSTERVATLAKQGFSLPDLADAAVVAVRKRLRTLTRIVGGPMEMSRLLLYCSGATWHGIFCRGL